MIRPFRDPSLRILYAATFVLGTAYGLSIALIALHLDACHFSKRSIGTLAAWFASGILACSVPAGRLIRRFSPKTTLVISLVGYAACVAVFPFLRSFFAIAVVRACDGACSVGIWVSSETALLERSDARHKASTTSIYAIVLALGYIVGPVCARIIVAVASIPTAFISAAFLATAASMIIAFGFKMHASAPDYDKHDRPFDHSSVPATTDILMRTKTCCFATFAYGYFQASVVLFLPLFLVMEKRIAEARTIVIPAFFAAGMLVFSNVAGRLGDRCGHLLLMRCLGFVGGLMIVGFIFIDDYPVMALAVFIAGATLASISPVSLAMQGIVVEPVAYSRANGLYNAFYAAGMLMGPPLSGWIYERYGGETMLVHLAVLWGAFVVFASIFRRDDPAFQRSVPVVLTPQAPPLVF